MTGVVRREGEEFEVMLRRWRNAIEKSGVIRQARRRTRFISKGEHRRLKRAKAEQQRRANKHKQLEANA